MAAHPAQVERARVAAEIAARAVVVRVKFSALRLA
jgi:hypothetical protein